MGSQLYRGVKLRAQLHFCNVMTVCNMNYMQQDHLIRRGYEVEDVKPKPNDFRPKLRPQPRGFKNSKLRLQLRALKKAKASPSASASCIQKVKALVSASASWFDQSFGFASASYSRASYPCLLIFIQYCVRPGTPACNSCIYCKMTIFACILRAVKIGLYFDENLL